MAIVKMSKISVVALLKDKSRVYDILQKDFNVHLKCVDNIEKTDCINNDDKIKIVVERKNNIDELIENIEMLTGTKTEVNCEYEDILVADNGKYEEAEKEFLNIKDELKTLKSEITANKEIRATLLVNSEEKLSVLKSKKLISFDITEDALAKEYVQVIDTKTAQMETRLNELNDIILKNKDSVADLKKLSDNLSVEISKLNADKLTRKTKNTFIAEFYIPKENAEKVKQKLEEVSPTVIVEIQKIKPEDDVPTLTKNNKLVSQAEFITNMYSVPSYHEIDPNFFVFWFYMIFFGYIMADMGLGIALAVIGYSLAGKIKESNGSKKLWTLIGTGGIFSIFWGFMYNSFFGFQILPFTIMPDPANQAILTLLICLLMGIIHISVAYFMKGLNAIRHGSVLDAILDGFLWDTFFIGAVMVATGFLLGFFKLADLSDGSTMSNILVAIQKPGIILLLVSIGLIAIFAGRKSKGIFPKIIKAFSSVYGIINLFSDILSYARLFGLMLSGAIIGQQFDAIGQGLMQGGSILGIVGGVVVILIGNAFNIAMGALGAYIHDCRLQYIEYFGKFYTGEGVLFTPFKPKLNYVNVGRKD